MSEDFGGDDAPPPMTAKQKRDAERLAKFQRGECRECANPVATKRNGQPASLCATHLKADRERKG